MGYYSDVAIVLCEDAAALLKKRLASASDDERALLYNPSQHIIDATGDELFRWSQIKWYEGYPEVDFITRFLHDIEQDDYLLVRTGEFYSDIEFDGDYYNNAFGLDVSVRMVIRGKVL